MMLGEPPPPLDTAVHVTPWPILEDPDFDPSGDVWDADSRQHFQFQDILSALQRYLPHGHPEAESDQDISDECSCDEFRMYEFKVRRCARGRSHDWTDCPYAHPGEKARRRDPRRYLYSGTACPDFRKGCCRKGDSCEFAHGVFECWLHPCRYRTQPCKDGMGCRRRVCFFAHSPEQLRVVSQQSPRSAITEATCMKALPFLASPCTISPEESPPMSPSSDVALSFRNLQLNKVKSLPASCLSGFGSGSAYGSPRGGPVVQTGFLSLPTTPTGAPTRKKIGWETGSSDEPVMERVESGRSLRARMFEKLSRENSLAGAAGGASEPEPMGCSLDVGWVSDLLK